MRKELVDRELLERIEQWVQEDSTALEELQAVLAQPAEAEGANIEAILKQVEREYEMYGLSDGLYADYATDVANRYAIATLSAVTAERDNYKSWYDDAMDASNIAGFAGMTAAQVIDYQDKEIMQLRAEVEVLRGLLSKSMDYFTESGLPEDLAAEYRAALAAKEG